MKKFAVLALLLVSAPAFADTWKGFITDSMCAARHKADNAEHIACAKKCLKGGEAAVFVVDGKIYKLDNPAAASKVIGRTVTLTGKLTGDTIHIEAVTL